MQVTPAAARSDNLPTRDELGNGTPRWKPWHLKAYETKGGKLTTSQKATVQRYERAQMLKVARERAKTRARVERWCAVIVNMRMEHKSSDEIGDRVGVSGTTICEWEAIFPDVFGPEHEAWVKRANNAANLARAQSYIAAKHRMADEALPSVNTVVELRDDRDTDEKGHYLVSPKVRLEAAKTILAGVGIGREKEATAGMEYAPDRVRVIRTVIEEILPGEARPVLEAEIAEAGFAEEAEEEAG